MKRIIPVMIIGMVVGMSACKEKKQTDDIITKKIEAPQKPTETQKMSDYTWDKTIAWLGSSYTIEIKRYSDTSLPVAEDESGRKYYDNKILLKVTRADGSVFFERTFEKKDFSSFINNTYGRNGALLGLAFDRAADGMLYFGASVGSPDSMSDEYIPLVVKLLKTGEVKIENDIELDTGSSQPRSEIEAAEEEGI